MMKTATMTTVTTAMMTMATNTVAMLTMETKEYATHLTTLIPITQTARIVRLQVTSGWSVNQTMALEDT